MTTRAAIFASFLVTGLALGCATDAPAPDEPGDMGTVDDVAMPGGDALLSRDGLRRAERDICELVPADGPCSLACDYPALIDQFVPEGTCVSFLCELTDGSNYVLDACHIEDGPMNQATGDRTSA